MKNGSLKWKRHESGQDLRNEDEVAQMLKAVWGASLGKLPDIYRVDFALFREREHKGWMEVKCRTVPSTKYSTFMLSYMKWLWGKWLAASSGTRFYVVVRFTDGVFWVDATDIDVPIGWWAHAQEENEQNEPVVYIPMTLFRRLGGTA